MAPIALIAYIHPTSPSTQLTTLTSLKSASQFYYAHPNSLCTAWTYFTLSTREGALYQPLSPAFPAKTDSPKLLIGGVEIYTDKSALSKQQAEPWFKAYERKVRDEGLYAEGKGEELAVWEPFGGFVSRAEKGREEGGKGVVVMLAVFQCKDSGESVDKAARVLSDFAAWAKSNEPGTLTYSVLVRPKKKQSNEIIMFERYKGAADLGKHGSSKEFKAMFKSVVPFIDPKKTRICEFEEIDTSFVGETLPKEAKL